MSLSASKPCLNADKQGLNVSLTPDYRLTSDGHQFIVLERYITQPAVNPPKDYVYIPTEKWREIAYYGLRSDSLVLAMDLAVVRTVAKSDAQSLTQFVGIIRKLTEDMIDAIRAAFLRENTEELARELAER